MLQNGKFHEFWPKIPKISKSTCRFTTKKFENNKTKFMEKLYIYSFTMSVSMAKKLFISTE